MSTTEGSTVLRWAGVTHVGKVRANNQDQFMLRPEMRLWVVADGMGGHKGGEEASDLACRTMSLVYTDQTVEGLDTAVRAANQAVHDAGMENPNLRGMGTTVVALAVVGTEPRGETPGGELIAIANVGDSRAYRLAHGRLEQLTDDHSLVADMVREGSLSPDEAETHPQKNILTRVLGVYQEIDVDIFTWPPQAGERYLLCSDGLFNEVSETTIETVLDTEPDPDAAARQLVELALESGARDNTTVLIIDVVDDGSGGPPTAAVPRLALSDQVPTREIAPPESGTRPIGAYSDPDENGNHQAFGSLDHDGTDRDPDGKPRRFTWRVALFMVLLLAVFGGTAAAIQWYGRAAYFVGFDDDNVAIFHGRPGGVAWVDPELVETSPLTRAELTGEQAVANLEEGQRFSSLTQAEEFVARLETRATAFIVGFDGDVVVIFEDRPGAAPQTIHRSELTFTEVTPADLPALADGETFTGTDAAQRALDHLGQLEQRAADAAEEEADDDDADDDDADGGATQDQSPAENEAGNQAASP